MANRLNVADHNLLSSNNICISCESNELGKIFSSSNRKLLTDNFNLFHQNIHSFNCNYDEFSVLLDSISNKLDALVVSETYFKQNQCSKIETYSDFHTVRSTVTLGGGVSLYVQNFHKSIKIYHLCKIFNTFELCTVKVYDGQCSFFILSLYRPPNSNLREFIDELTICQWKTFQMMLM